MIKFKELADLALLAVNGGKFTSEAAVQRPEVNSFIPVAVHSAITEHVFRLQAEKRANRASSGFSEAILDGAFFDTHILPIKEDSNRKAKYIELPSLVQSLPGLLAIESVFPKSDPQSAFAIVNGPSGVIGVGSAMPSCWHERHNEKSRIYFDGLPSDSCELVVRACMEISPDLDEEPIPMPTGFEYRVIEYCLAHFRGQRQSPGDALIDNHDVNAITGKQ